VATCTVVAGAAAEAVRPAPFEQIEPTLSRSLSLRPAARLGGMTVKSKETSGGRDVEVAERSGVPAQFDAAVEDSRTEKEANTVAYRAASRKTTEESLNRYLKGIGAGAARAVLEDMQSFAPEDGRILYDLVVAHGCKRGIEIGTARGNSAIWLGLAFKKNGGRLITIEMNSELAKTANENFKRAGLADIVECRNNDAFKEIPLLEGGFDFVFMDTGTPLHKKFMDLLYDRVAAGGAITSHNSNTFESQMPDFLKAITTDPNLDTKITRTLSGGVSVSIKRK
jgi:predicted O-methyltransferase YrrM